MDSKKHFASLMEEDHSPGPGAPALSRGGGGWCTYATPSHSSGLDFDLGQGQGRGQQPAVSCVTRETSQTECARHRFIVWAAVKRNSSVRMTPQEKLKCPLLRCTQRFPDHEAMLKHLAACRHLPSGEYWCHDHMRVERFDDARCKRCLDHPSKRRKLLCMARKFFHSLGHRPKKRHAPGLVGDDVLLPPPPSYDSLNIPRLRGNATELPSTEILEIDSVEVPSAQCAPAPAPAPAPASVPVPVPVPVPGPGLAPSDYAINPQALLMPVVPALPELDSTMPSSENLMQWQPVPGVAPPPFPFVQRDDGDSVRNPALKPTLQLTTDGLQGRRQAPRPAARPAHVIPRGKGLSPSSSVRSTASTDTNTSLTSNGSSMISPVSNWSGAWSMASGPATGMTSPVDGILVDDLFADAVNNYNNACPDFLHNFFSELPADMPADLPVPKDASGLGSGGLFGFEAPAPASLPHAPGIAVTDDVAELPDLVEHRTEPTNTCCSDAKSLVGSAWDALQEHVVSSMVKIQDQRENPLAGQLASMSIRTIATTGLRALRALVEGHQPSSPTDALCLIHVVYALNLVLHERGIAHRFNNLFLQSLTYGNSLPLSDRGLYRQLVISIWQPPDLSQADMNDHFAMATTSPLSRSPDPKGKSPEMLDVGLGQRDDDPLLIAARDFLDELEMTLVLSPDALPLDVQVSDLHIRHLKDAAPAGPVNEALLSTVKSVLESLLAGFGHAQNLNGRLQGIHQRLRTGAICSVRRVELELLHAGRSCVPSTNWSNFASSVRRLCDQLYERHDVGTSRRNAYHGLGIALIESLVPEFDSSTGKAAGLPLDDTDALFSELSADVGNTATSLAHPQPAALHNLDGGVNEAQLPTPTATVGGSPPGTQTTSPPAEAAQQPGAGRASETQQAAGQKVEAASCCEICGYRPKGDPQWFKGSMAKHKKLQHSTEPPKIYKCPYPGCTSQYKNRPDNLRQHQIEKNHWVHGEESAPRRPSKRKKVAADGQ